MQLRRGDVTRGELLEVGVDERDYEALAAGLQRAAAPRHDAGQVTRGLPRASRRVKRASG